MGIVLDVVAMNKIRAVMQLVVATDLPLKIRSANVLDVSGSLFTVVVFSDLTGNSDVIDLRPYANGQDICFPAGIFDIRYPKLRLLLFNQS